MVDKISGVLARLKSLAPSSTSSHWFLYHHSLTEGLKEFVEIGSRIKA